MRDEATPAASSALAAATGTRAATEAKALRGRMGKAAARVSQPHGSHTSHMMINQNGTEQREQVMESLSLAQEVPPVLDLPLLWLRLLRPHTTNGGLCSASTSTASSTTSAAGIKGGLTEACARKTLLVVRLMLRTVTWIRQKCEAENKGI